MKWLTILVLAAGLIGCNPAARCKASVECGAGVCTGGFCSDLSGISGGDGGPPDRSDSDAANDAGQVPDAGVVDYDAGNNGRGP